MSFRNWKDIKPINATKNIKYLSLKTGRICFDFPCTENELNPVPAFIKKML